ncbi:ARP5 [Candida jiufengensis]|uniref:ARP5 n=1 Tax=Candida jiufengensis TaxID=497108 RepID=UPI0022252E10|nr:ARP5 [Candida jiufengensis]KAI5954307.1 ARP5 [Candida jiufengensis]
MAPSKLKPEEETYPPQEIHYLKDIKIGSNKPEPFYQNYQPNVPIAIDLGTSTWRIGLTNNPEPNNVFPGIISRHRDRKALKTLTIIGNDIFGDSALKSTLKTPYDGPLITNWDYIEFMLDYSFEHLGVTSNNGRLNNPIIMTEPITCPYNQRKTMYELLFEAYQVPKVSFGLDSLFSFYANTNGKSTGLVIGSGNQSTSIIPVIDGKGLMTQAKRIDWGGDQSQSYLSRLLSLKYPYFPNKLNQNHTTNLFQDFCYISQDYDEELKHILDMDVLETKDVVVQAPVEINVSTEPKKSDEELAKQAEKRKEQGKRLQKQAQQKRIEKLVQKQEEWDYYTKYKEDNANLSPEEFEELLIRDGFEDLEDFKKYMASLDRSLKRAASLNDDGEDDDEEEEVNTSRTWPLVDIPDDQLTEDQIKEKRKQKLHKANVEARERNRELKKQEEEAKLKFEQEQQEWRERDLDDWSSAKKVKVAELISRFKDRQKLLDSMKDRKSAAAQQRMKNIADLANDDNGSTSAASRKRRRNANATIDNDPNDNFGANDDDWNAYREISNKSVEEELDKINQEIMAVEDELLKYDPNFHHEDTFAAANSFDWKNSVLHKFIHGPRSNITIAMQAEGLSPEEIANHPEIIRKNHQIHLNIERLRVPEVLFQPTMGGLDQAGISEIANDLLVRRLGGDFATSGVSYKMAQNIFLTGGLALIPGFSSRIERDFRGFLPTGVPLHVKKAKDPLLDPWHGMYKWANNEEDSGNAYVTQAEYEELGPEYIKEHGLGNACIL